MESGLNIGNCRPRLDLYCDRIFLSHIAHVGGADKRHIIFGHVFGGQGVDSFLLQGLKLLLYIVNRNAGNRIVVVLRQIMAHVGLEHAPG